MMSVTLSKEGWEVTKFEMYRMAVHGPSALRMLSDFLFSTTDVSEALLESRGAIG